MKKTLIFLLAFALLLPLAAGCGSTAPPEDTAPYVSSGEAEQTTAPESEAPNPAYSTTSIYKIGECLDRVKVLGRYSTQGVGIGCDFSACGIEFTADCQGEVKIKVQALSTDVYFAVFIDGEKQAERPYVKKEQTAYLTAAKDLAPGVHTIRFVKESESRQSSTLLHISLCGTLLDPPAKKDLYIEVVGDSITCGFGLGDAASIKKDIKHYGATKSYGYLLAELLDADYSIVSAASFATAGTNSLPDQIWKYTAFRRSVKPKYDFARQPDVMVINLGTNDGGSSEAHVPEATFDLALKRFILTVRSDYKKDDLPIVFVYNMMSDGYQSRILQIVRELGGEEARLYTYKAHRDNSLGGHPGAAAHQNTAEGLSQLIRETILK